MLHEETTRSRHFLHKMHYIVRHIGLTGVVSRDSSLHESLHPLTDSDVLLGAEVMALIRVVHDTETVAAGVDVLIRNYLVTGDVDVTLDLRLLQCSCEVAITEHSRRSVPLCSCSVANTDVGPSGRSTAPSSCCTFRPSCAAIPRDQASQSVPEYSGQA